jgi:hypothetical protein
MDTEKIWQKLNSKNPDPLFLKELLRISPDLKEELFSTYVKVLNSEDWNQEWAIMNWTRYASYFHPKAYFDPIFYALKKMVLSEDKDDLYDGYLYNSLLCFLEETVDGKAKVKGRLRASQTQFFVQLEVGLTDNPDLGCSILGDVEDRFVTVHEDPARFIGTSHFQNHLSWWGWR